MNIIKKIIIVISVAVIIIRTFAFEVFAFSAAPVIAAEEITTLLETALIGSGLYTESELEGKSYLELNDLLKDGVNSGQINPKADYYTDPISGIQFELMDLLTKPEVQAGIGITNSAIYNTVGNAVNDWWYGMQSKGEELYDLINPTYSGGVDMQGGTCVYYDYDFKDPRYYTVYYSSQPGHLYYSGDQLRLYINYDYREFHSPNGVTRQDHSSTLSTAASNGTYYGKWILEDEEVNVGGEEIPVIGEADGTQVTVDMLNPDGTVTIDGTTYYPKDYIDWDKFKDEAIIDLLNDILAKIDSIPVSETDTTKDLVDSITDSISIPDELSDYIMPTGISSVFPFCLPFDLYRGVKLLSANPVAPVLEIPFEVPEFGYFKGYKTVLTIEFEKYDKYFSVFRWGIYFIFALSLVFISTKIVKGAGA